MDFEQFEGIIEVDETYFLYSQKGQRGTSERKLVNVAVNLNIEALGTNQVRILVARDLTKATVSKVTCMGRVVKTKVESMIGTKLTPNNVLITDAWRAYKTYAKEQIVPKITS